MLLLGGCPKLHTTIVSTYWQINDLSLTVQIMYLRQHVAIAVSQHQPWFKCIMHSSTPAWLSTQSALHPHYHCSRQKHLISIVLLCNRSVGGQPIVFDRVKGPYCWDVDGNKYVDYIGSWGPAIVGAANDEVNEALKAQIEKGTSFGAPSALEVCPWDMQPHPGSWVAYSALSSVFV